MKLIVSHKLYSEILKCRDYSEVLYFKIKNRVFIDLVKLKKLCKNGYIPINHNYCNGFTFVNKINDLKITDINQEVELKAVD